MSLKFGSPTPGAIGHHFIVGLSGTTLDDSDRRVLESVRPIGILLLARNFDHTVPYPDWLWKLETLLNDVRKITGHKDLLITLDHESERVHRTPPPLTKFPQAIHFKEHAAAVAAAHAEEIRSLGVNLSWAPVTDIHSNAANPIIGERAFGTSPDSAARYATAYLKALEDGGILGCAKHFPGHGDTIADSHLELPRVDLNFDELRRRELIPFQALFSAGVSFCMTAHILYPKIDPSFPATLSKTFISDLARDEMKFDGVMVTDDLDMDAVAADFNKESAIIRAMNVGCDMFIVARTKKGLEDRTITLASQIEEALASGEIAYERVCQAFDRIERVLRDKLQHHKPYVLSEETLAKHAELAAKIRR